MQCRQPCIAMPMPYDLTVDGTPLCIAFVADENSGISRPKHGRVSPPSSLQARSTALDQAGHCSSWAATPSIQRLTSASRKRSDVAATKGACGVLETVLPSDRLTQDRPRAMDVKCAAFLPRRCPLVRCPPRRAGLPNSSPNRPGT